MRVTSVRDAQSLLALDEGFEVTLALRRDTAPWLLSLDVAPPRLALYQPTYERLTEAAERDVDPHDFFARFHHVVPVEGVPACVLGRAPRARPRTLDASMLRPDGALEIFRYTRRYILEHYRSKSLRCKSCVHEASCEGMHINQVRAHGYALMRPVS